MIRQKIGQYRVLERLGAGGMGSVYRAVDEMLGRDVALKVLDTAMEESTARLRAEAAALARLSHPGIATVYELLEDDSRLVMAMELVRGQTLQQIVEHVGVFSPRRAAELCMQALAALEHAHVTGVVHRDLKPGNLMLTDAGTIKILDFGIARLDGSVHLTGAGAMLGTPAYMAPEQVLGHPVDKRADLYAMGVVFFRLVTAALPFKGDTPFDMAQSQVKDPPIKARDLRSDLPEWVDDILARALAKKPVDRFQSSVEMHEAFARAIGHTPRPMPIVQMEATEVMARPVFTEPSTENATEPAIESEPVEDPENRALAIAREIVIDGDVVAPRPRRTGWITAASVALLAAAAWTLIPVDSAAPNSATSTSALAEATSSSASAVEPQPVTAAGAGVPARTAAADVPAPAKVTDAADRRVATTPATPAAESAAASALPTASFGEVKLLAVNGTRTTASDALVQFSTAEVSVQSPKTKSPASVLAYRGIVKATYSHAKDPKWDPALSGPTGKIDVPGILGRARHWLVLQGTDGYVILRLDNDDRVQMMKAFEERAHIVIDRATNGK
jgi:serine/threonine-protein kinase